MTSKAIETPRLSWGLKCVREKVSKDALKQLRLDIYNVSECIVERITS